MSLQVELIGKAVRTIKSCQTAEQLKFAIWYCNLTVKKYRKLAKSYDIYDEIEQGLKAVLLAKELKQLLDERFQGLSHSTAT